MIRASLIIIVGLTLGGCTVQVQRSDSCKQERDDYAGALERPNYRDNTVYLNDDGHARNALRACQIRRGQ